MNVDAEIVFTSETDEWHQQTEEDMPEQDRQKGSKIRHEVKVAHCSQKNELVLQN